MTGGADDAHGQAESQAACLAVIGNVNVDLIMGPQAPWPRPGTEVVVPGSEFRVGGAAGNTALALTGLGVPHRLVANTGDDLLGRWLADSFDAAARAWPLASTSTAISVGITHPDGERTFFTDTGHLARLDAHTVLDQLPDRVQPGSLALLVGTFVTPALLPDYPDLIGTLRRRGFAIALDTGWPDEGWTAEVRRMVSAWLGQCDHLLLNEIEVQGLADSEDLDAAASHLRQAMPSGASLVVKRGPSGATGWQMGERAAVSAPTVTVADTIGAGDIFNAGYLSGVLRGLPLHRCLKHGVETASRAISTKPRRYREHLVS